MRNLYCLFIASFYLTASAQTNTTLTNFDGVPDLVPQATWNYSFSADWCFWAGFGIACSCLFYGIIYRFFLEIAASEGGSDFE